VNSEIGGASYEASRGFPGHGGSHADYQLRYFDAYSGTVVLETTIDVHDDEQAISEAESRRGLAPMELRRDKKVIRRWPAFPPSPPSFKA
jgi:hypothetical protein